MLVKSLAIGDTLNAGVSSHDLSKPICGCARTIAAAVEQLLLKHAHAAIARGFAGQWNAAARETSGNDPQGHPDLRDRPLRSSRPLHGHSISSRNTVMNTIAPSEIATRHHSSGKLLLRPFQ
ncbi:hypothetical protein [Ensifer adhaerens]|uniref:hypothetical protein n=1 Tax=Ensifer adhaerens TaxID=106592 RepID=UPI0013792B2F|nr:hypothetical protein [Ensifer adhaerens]